MNFQNIPPMERPQHLLDVALSRARDKANRARKKPRDHVKQLQASESARISACSDVLHERYERIVRYFPNFDRLSLFYKEMSEATLELEATRKALHSIQWAATKIRELGRKASKRAKSVETEHAANLLVKGYLGRISSIVKKTEKDLKTLEKTRYRMRSFPDVKAGIPAAVIFGFPNVGKTTLLQKLAGSTAEVAAYSFTTKGINGGTITLNNKEVQVFDTPGTLARKDKMNTIEKIAHITMEYVAKVIIYVFDPTEPFPLKDQELLYSKLKKRDTPVIVYVSKSDIQKSDKKGVRTVNSLKKELIKALNL